MAAACLFSCCSANLTHHDATNGAYAVAFLKISRRAAQLVVRALVTERGEPPGGILRFTRLPMFGRCHGIRPSERIDAGFPGGTGQTLPLWSDGASARICGVPSIGIDPDQRRT